MTPHLKIDSRITRQLEQGPCTLESLATSLNATYSWNQVFIAVDILSRKGAITLLPHARFQYLVSLAPASRPTSQRSMQ
jgi:hypothetical protein